MRVHTDPTAPRKAPPARTEPKGEDRPAVRPGAGPELLDGRPTPERGLTREEVYDRPVVDGRVVSQSAWARLRRWLTETLTSRGEREEADLERRLHALPRATKPNIVPVMSPKGGVGKTSMTFALGSLYARLGHRVVAVDLNPDHGTLGSLAPVDERSEGSLAELLDRLENVETNAQVGRYVARLSSGLHLLAGSEDPEVMAKMGPVKYGKLLAFLSRYYDLILLDLGTGVTEKVPRFALREAHQVVVVTTPDWNTVEKTHKALGFLAKTLDDCPITVALNQIEGGKRNAIASNVENALGRAIGRTVTVPRDDRLRLMLDSGTYNLDALPRPTRTALRELGVAVGRQIV